MTCNKSTFETEALSGGAFQSHRIVGHADDQDTAMIARRVCRAFPRYAYRFSNEAQLHDRLALVLEQEAVGFTREHVIGSDRFDFLCDGGVVIEVKVDGSINEAIRQADRYCAHAEVRSVVIVSSRGWRGCSSGPFTLRGKAVHLVRVRGQAF